MRKRILDLHLYLGLLCAPYLIVYGLSGLAFNHGWQIEEIPAGRWKATLQAEAPDPASHTPLERARALQADQALVGTVEERSVAETGMGGLAFRVQRPGADYDVAFAPDGTIEIARTRTGIWRVLQGVHGLRRLDGSVLAPLWWIYTEASVWTLVFASLSGIYLWARTSRMTLGIGTIALGAIVFSILAMGVW